MSTPQKSQAEILSKLGIEQLNPMQLAAQKAIESSNEIILLSPTGTGKTLAFLLPLIQQLDVTCEEIQLVIIVPSRELAIQIEQVMREMGTGFKVNAVYGGRAGSKDRIEIKHRPAVLVGTPGRVSDHLRRDAFDTSFIRTLVLDEFDKSLEIGFESEMKDILHLLPKVKKMLLTSATQGVEIPRFVGLKSPVTVDFLEDKITQLQIKKVLSPTKDKLETLVELISHLGKQNGIIFCNFKDSIQRVGECLEEHGISHGIFSGGMEQTDRERSLIKFRNGTHQILLATDLAARGIDVPEIKFIIHYHLPLRSEEFIHRNGRTARMNSDGTAYVLHYERDPLPDFIGNLPIEKLTKSKLPSPSEWSTLFVSGGRKDKISKGDVAGLFFKQGNLEKDQLGVIELKTDCAFVGVKTATLEKLLPKVNNMKLKEKKVRVTVI
ncbi:DEAD/DEAH box helicase [Algoriphagus sp.]|uniref:DEAD/DEAH box helicase n=1 Tax=Algoriphagus sp. TaxID=1872435 RepID=UPI002727769A|nr:DEAD/DEAH box helicase [Algoriphagus sp.]MDO8966155.1 DEAD/DEAH box helicase [Algoriphagus sp.]MDP3200933.1 DEAD/DEAH box helicase [Algoriphagus sp.]